RRGGGGHELEVVHDDEPGAAGTRRGADLRHGDDRVVEDGDGQPGEAPGGDADAVPVGVGHRPPLHPGRVDVTEVGQPSVGQFGPAHLQRGEQDRHAGVGDVEGDLPAEGGLADAGPGGHDVQFAGVEAGDDLVEGGEPGGDGVRPPCPAGLQEVEVVVEQVADAGGRV